MKDTIKHGMLYTVRFLLNVIYAVMKLFPVRQNKILYCTRQSNEPLLDFKLLKEALEGEGYVYVTKCVKQDGSRKSSIILALKTLSSMYHLATCKLCIIDSYWPAVCMLHHRKSLTVIQMWHALGKIKQSSYQTLGRKSGRDVKNAEILCMHKNYDWVIAGAEFWNPYYCECFRIEESRLKNYGLPRIDYLLKTEEEHVERFRQAYPQYEGKTIVLYAPTFRKHMEDHWDQIIDTVRGDENLLLIIKKHPLLEIPKEAVPGNVLFMSDWSTVDLIAVCDYFITDYSASALEAAVLKKRTYYWTYDYDEYVISNGLNLDLKKEFPGYVFENIDDLVDQIRKGDYDDRMIENYRNTYLPRDLGHSTEYIKNFVTEIMNSSESTAKLPLSDMDADTSMS